jgi:DNA-binding NtrC family response regulator
LDQLEVRITGPDPPEAGFVLGRGAALLELDFMARNVSRTDIPVLILGEGNTGKDAYARLIHRLSHQGTLPFSKINCSALSLADLLTQLQDASMAFAEHKRVTGTIYLDNIQDLDLDCQRLLLSRIPDGANEGPTHELRARLISSGTPNLEAEVEAGRFRRELFFRLNGACLRLPPLRERKEDIPALLDHFLNKHGRFLGKKVSPLTSRALQTLKGYHWPGNIRELENLARKIVVFGDVQMALNDLQTARMAVIHPSDVRPSSLKVASRAARMQAERELIMLALERTRWNRKRAARELQISYKSLLYKIKQIGAVNKEHQG